MYQYKMVQVPPNIQVQAKEHKGNEAATYLQNVVNLHAKDGWEFYRTDNIGVSLQPGCLAGVLGQKESLQVFYVITFRKPI